MDLAINKVPPSLKVYDRGSLSYIKFISHWPYSEAITLHFAVNEALSHNIFLEFNTPFELLTTLLFSIVLRN